MTTSRLRLVCISLVVSLALFALGGCSAAGEVRIDADGSGEVVLEVRVSDVLLDYLEDLAVSFGSDWSGAFDVSAIDAHFAAHPGIELVSARARSSRELALVLAFDDVSAVDQAAWLAPEAVEANPVRFFRDGDLRRLEVVIEPSTVPALLSLSPLGGSELQRYLLPPPGGDMSAAEYQDYLSWSLEEYATDRELEQMFSSAVIRLELGISGDLVSQSGGVVSGDAVVFELPVIELLTGSQAARYSVEFRP